MHMTVYTVATYYIILFAVATLIPNKLLCMHNEAIVQLCTYVRKLHNINIACVCNYVHLMA